MKKLALILTLIASYSTWAQGDVEAGKSKAAVCAACHGADGNSLMAQNPKLAGQHSGYLEKQLQDFKSAMSTGGKQGRNSPLMGGMAMRLSEQDIADLSAYYSAQPISDNTTPESSIEVGQQLYRFGDPERGIAACIACHGPRGNGASLAGFPKISGQHAEYTKIQLEKFRSAQRNNDLNEMMRSVVAKLSDDEISALSQYVGGLH